MYSKYLTISYEEWRRRGDQSPGRITQPRSQSSSAIFDVTSPVKLVGKFGKVRAIALGSKPPLITRRARTGLGTRLRITDSHALDTRSECIVVPRVFSFSNMVAGRIAHKIFETES